ncbi:porphyromonas-type peptidyl-arginine deiminase [Trichoderma citrinoviride]|uniref:Porphyromonas-type peptidyl-arginine deiminase n=1 Tax=Trichoderma citrinoviride TaxID=58853 RepID=A0A2T4BKY9_9HYPO|nr:porphyromonas-type peptidyl-arginine deiminase [Trichoderma citrinoviride]PTB69976.1 porphyromonas-type peptidyl-arginine deiminase [Trichoderma citrinoviride]
MSDVTFQRRAEWAPQKGIIMGWPGLNGVLGDHPDRLVKATKEVSSLAAAIAQFEPVTMIVGSERLEEAQAQFAEVDTPFDIKVQPIKGDSMDVWLRDFAPVFVIKNGPGADRSLVGLDYNFNGWGGRYPTDTIVGFAKTLLKDFDLERIGTSIVTEGGALETDGDGTLLVTESSIVNDNRNPGKSRQEIEDELVRTLGVEKVIWIPGRPGLDATDCHIDALARFVRPGVILLSKTNEVKPTDWTVVYEEALDILSSSTDAKGRPLEVIEVEEPDEEVFEGGGFNDRRAVRSYVNYLLVNGGVILPQFGDPAHDAAAIRTTQRVFGDERRICPVLIEELPTQGGGVHCTTQEITLFP